MKDYQKRSLRYFFNFITGATTKKVLILTLPEDVPEIQKENEQAFLAEAASFFKERQIEPEIFPLQDLQSMWDDRYYDCILLRYVLYLQRTRAMDERKTLAILGRHLTPEGRLYVLEHNRLGIRTLAGDRFDGTGKEQGLLYSELSAAVSYAGLRALFYFPHPFMEGMDYLFSDERPPEGEKLSASLEEEAPRMEFNDEKELLSAASKAGVFPRLANQILCVAGRQEEEGRLLFRQYPQHRKEWCAVVRSEYRTGEGSKLIVRQAESDRGMEHVKQIVTSYLNMDTLYKGYTLQIAPCKLEKKRILSVPPEGETLEELLDDAIDREWMDGYFRWIKQMMDIMTTPIQIAILDGSAKRKKLFSEDARFVDYFGALTPEEDALFEKEPVLPYTPICCRFGDFSIQDRRWLFYEYEWMASFPVPFSYVLYHAVTEFFDGKAERDRNGTLRRETLQKFGIPQGAAAIYARMKAHFEAFIRDDSPDPDALLSEKKRNGTFLPVGEWTAVFTDGHGQIPVTREQELEEVGEGFADKLRSVIKGWWA